MLSKVLAHMTLSYSPPQRESSLLKITMETGLAANFSNPPASVSQMLELQIYTTMSRHFFPLQGFDSLS